MSNSRRGLLAAGLAVAVVGSMGTVWTLNASADETPDAEAPAAAVAPEVAEAEAPAAAVAPADVDASAATPVPPALLPWGTRPKKIKRAKAGASSRAVADAGAAAAPADTSGSMTPTPAWEPKGLGPQNTSGKGMRSTIVPPAPPAVAGTSVVTAKAADPKPVYHYLVGTQIGETDGSWANLTIEKPLLAKGDSHTLAEISVESGGDKPNAVEVGWTVDRAVNGDSDPHLFVFFWKDGEPQCYNACGFTMYSKTVKPGDTLPVGSSKRFGIQHSGGAWWVAYDSEWIGYFSDKNWEGRYTRGLVTQWFGEIASAKIETCTQMGNGKPASDGNAARIGSISMTNGPRVSFGLDPRPKYRADPDNPGTPETAGALDPAVPVKSPDGGPDVWPPWWSPWTGSIIGEANTTFRYGGPNYPADEKGNPVVKC